MANPGTALMTLPQDGGTLHRDPRATVHLASTHASSAYFAVPSRHAENRQGVVSTVIKVADEGQRSIVFVAKRAIGRTSSSSTADLLTRSVHDLPETYFEQLKAEVADSVPETAATFVAPRAPSTSSLPRFDPLRFVPKLATHDDSSVNDAEAAAPATMRNDEAEPRSDAPNDGIAPPSEADVAVAAALAIPEDNVDEDSDDEPPAEPEPSPEASEPSPEASEPSPEATEPSPEASEPSPEASEPSPEASEPPPEATLQEQLDEAEEALRLSQADCSTKKQVVKSWISAFQAEQGRTPTTDEKRAIRTEFDAYAAASASKKEAEARVTALREQIEQ